MQEARRSKSDGRWIESQSVSTLSAKNAIIQSTDSGQIKSNTSWHPFEALDEPLSNIQCAWIRIWWRFARNKRSLNVYSQLLRKILSRYHSVGYLLPEDHLVCQVYMQARVTNITNLLAPLIVRAEPYRTGHMIESVTLNARHHTIEPSVSSSMNTFNSSCQTLGVIGEFQITISSCPGGSNRHHSDLELQLHTILYLRITSLFWNSSTWFYQPRGAHTTFKLAACRLED